MGHRRSSTTRSICPVPPATKVRVRADSVAPFLRRLVTMLDVGMPLAESLEFLLLSEQEPGLKIVIDYLCKGINAGMRLSDAMRPPAFRSVFDSVIIGMIRMGEETGALARAVGVVAELTEAQLRLRRAMVSALTYPVVLLIAIVGAGLLFVAILGAPGGLFSMFGNDLPGPTRALVQAAAVVRSPLIMGLVLLAVAGLATGWHLALEHSPSFRRVTHVGVLRLPVLGNLLRKSLTARMLCVLSNCLEVGLPLVQSLRLSATVCTNLAILEPYYEALNRFKEGNPLSEAWESGNVFPGLVTSMVRLGEESGNLDGLMGRLSKMYEEDVMDAVERSVLLVEPFLMLVAGLCSMFLAVATLLPIIRLTQRL